ncbi:MAG: PilZ domain-containing protein [Pseudomonadota bacterium]
MSKPLPHHDLGLETVHRRGASRLRLAAPAVFMGHSGRQLVTLLDLSQTGARLAFKQPPDSPAGFINWLEFETFGELVWRERLYAGFAFDEAIPMDWLLTTRHESEYIEEKEHAKIREAARSWVVG